MSWFLRDWSDDSLTRCGSAGERQAEGDAFWFLHQEVPVSCARHDCCSRCDWYAVFWTLGGTLADFGAAATPGRAKVSDFDRVFHPFSIKADVTLAPTNRFRKGRTGKLADVAINSLSNLSAQGEVLPLELRREHRLMLARRLHQGFPFRRPCPPHSSLQPSSYSRRQRPRHRSRDQRGRLDGERPRPVLQAPPKPQQGSDQVPQVQGRHQARLHR